MSPKALPIKTQANLRTLQFGQQPHLNKQVLPRTRIRLTRSVMR